MEMSIKRGFLDILGSGGKGNVYKKVFHRHFGKRAARKCPLNKV
jgi:hypothetical protein